MKTRILLVIAVAVVAAVGLGLREGWFHRETGLHGSGTVEARNIRVGSKVGGRIDQVLVREGDTVKAGQVLITFDDKELKAQLAQSKAAAEKATRGYRKEDIAQAQASADQAQADYEMRKNGYRKEDIEAAKADLDRASADETRTRLDYQRYDALAQKDLVSKQQRDTAEANWKMALAQKESAAHKLAEFQRGYRPEEVLSAKARYEEAKANLDKMERGNRVEDVDAAKAAYAYDEARFREREVISPADATVEVLDVRPGDLIAPNNPVATLLENDQVYVRIYIPETELGRVYVGQPAQVRVDTFPDQPFAGIVEQINQQGEFLPRNVQTRNERVHQMFGVKIRIDSPKVMPGMAADVVLQEKK